MDVKTVCVSSSVFPYIHIRKTNFWWRQDLYLWLQKDINLASWTSLFNKPPSYIVNCQSQFILLTTIDEVFLNLLKTKIVSSWLSITISAVEDTIYYLCCSGHRLYWYTYGWYNTFTTFKLNESIQPAQAYFYKHESN